MSNDIERFAAKLEEIRDDLQAYSDDKSEKWQESERGQAVQAALDSLDDAINALQS